MRRRAFIRYDALRGGAAPEAHLIFAGAIYGLLAHEFKLVPSNPRFAAIVHHYSVRKIVSAVAKEISVGDGWWWFTMNTWRRDGKLNKTSIS